MIGEPKIIATAAKLPEPGDHGLRLVRGVALEPL